MRSSRAMTTCVPIEMDDSVWQTAVFFELGGKECEQDRMFLKEAKAPVQIGLEADLIEQDTASVVMLRFEVLTGLKTPLAGDVLILPGIGNVQFETLNYLTSQSHLPFYFSDGSYQVVHKQQVVLRDQERAAYRSLLDDAVSHDAMIRLSGRYNAMTALKEVTGNYAAHVSREEQQHSL